MKRSTIVRHLPGASARQLLLAGTLITGVLGGGLAVHAQTAQATKKQTTAPAPPGGPPLAGTIQTGSSTLLTITVNATRKTARVHLTAATHYLVNAKPTTKAPRWTKGEQVQVMATKGKDGSYTAQAVFVGKPPAAPAGTGGPLPGGAPPGMAPPINGTVVSASNSTLTLKTAKGTRITVKLMASTRFVVNGKAVSKRPAFKAGQQVHVLTAASRKTAQLVIVGAMPAPPGGAPPQ